MTKQFYVKIFTGLLALSAVAVAVVPAAAAAGLSTDHASLVSPSANGKTLPSGDSLNKWTAGRGAAPLLAPLSAPATLPLTTPAPATAQPECPPVLMSKCKFVPAAYQQVDPQDDSNYGNYDIANRPAGGLKINTIVIHDTESSLASTLAEFQNPAAYVSAHYVIDKDGAIYQTVPTKDIAWHAGNWYTNEHSIGIEHVGTAAGGHTDYSPQMYLSSALLVKWLAAKYDIPLDRQHIIGHDNVPAPTAPLVAGMHWDPGAFWNWQHYLLLLGAPVMPTARPDSGLVTISPNFAANRPPVTNCPGNTTCPPQGANFVYLHTAPSDTAPLLSDPALHPGGVPGTTQIQDWSATAVYGQQFALAGRQGDWTAVWFGGQTGWFKNPAGIVNALPTRGQTITPRAGHTSISVYGRAYPEAGAYPAAVPVQSIVPLQYQIPAGQSYATTGLAPTDYFYTWTIDAHLPNDHTLITGQDQYYQIQFNHRLAYVKASDVELNTNQ